MSYEKENSNYEFLLEWSDPVPFTGYGLENGARRGTWQRGYTFFLDEYDTREWVHCIDLRVVQPHTWSDILIDTYDTYEQLEDSLFLILQFLWTVSPVLHIED